MRIGRRAIAGAAVLVLTAALPIASAGCGSRAQPASQNHPATLTIGFGLPTGANPTVGVRQVVTNLATEGLIIVGADGRPRPWLAENWSVSPDGLTVKVRLRQSVAFHDGTLATASFIRDLIAAHLRSNLGELADDVREVRATSDRDIEFLLTQRSALLPEALFDPIQKEGSSLVGTGPFENVEQADGQGQMRANEHYYLGRPLIDRILIRPYPSVRSAWADMLRGNVDMLYDVGVEALDSLERSSDVGVFVFQRPYALLAVLNTQAPHLRNPRVRQLLNAAIDREDLLSEVFRGHGSPADGPISPRHWAYEATASRFQYRPQPIGTIDQPLKLTCLLSDPSFERLALALQKQLASVGVDLQPEIAPADAFMLRLTSGNFDAALVDVASGPGLIPPYLFWHTGGRYNWAHYSDRAVDAALDTIRHAASDDEYKAGVAAFQRAIVANPPAIFLVWSERARAVSRRFDVPAEPGVDILRTLRLWRPTTDRRVASRN